MLKIFTRNKHVIVYAGSLAVLLFLLKWLETRFWIIDHASEIYIGAIAVIFTVLGIWLALRLVKPKTVIIEKEIVVEKEVFKNVGGTFVADEAAIVQSGLSRRELEVLQLMSEGNSNQEIAEKLFVSLNTIKTHSSRIFEKLDVKRRTQAVEIAKRRKLID